MVTPQQCQAIDKVLLVALYISMLGDFVNHVGAWESKLAARLKSYVRSIGALHWYVWMLGIHTYKLYLCLLALFQTSTNAKMCQEPALNSARTLRATTHANAHTDIRKPQMKRPARKQMVSRVQFEDVI